MLKTVRKNVKVSIIIYDLVVFHKFLACVYWMGVKGIKYRHLAIISSEVIEGKKTFAFVSTLKSDHNVSSAINLLFIILYDCYPHLN